MLGHGFGAFHAPVGSSLFCFYGFQKTFVQRTQKDFPNLPQMQSFGTREHGPLAGFVTRSDREFQNGDTIMETNLAILIGNLGGHAKTGTTKAGRPYTTFSMATSTRYKNKEGKYTTHTEWHRCFIFGPRAEGAKDLDKGTFIEVRGAIQHTDIKGIKRDSIVVKSFLKLDRSERVESDEDEHEEIPDEALAE
jgi:single stranded DNA-binding protein